MSDMNHHDHDHDHSEAELAAKKAARPQIERDNKYWVNLEHYNMDPEFMAKASTEFDTTPLRLNEGEDENGVDRRDFLKLMSASLALASASCVRRPVQKIVPYNKQPEEITLGIPNYYASSTFDGSEVIGHLVKTREGRPIHIEGQQDHPLTSGVSIKSQAQILGLYDPERLRGPKKSLFNEKKTNKDTIAANWDDMDKDISEQLKKGGVVLLTGAITGPANTAVVSEFQQAFKADHVVFEPFSHEEIRDGQKASYGEETVPNYRFDKAKMIVSVDADFLGTWLAPTMFTKQFSDGRKDPATMSRMVSFDSAYTLTGANADIRVRIKPSQQLTVVLALINELAKGGKGSISESARNVAKGADAAALGMEPALLTQIANDLWENRGQSLVVAGGLQTMTKQARDLQIAVNMLNSLLDNDGKTVERGGNPGLRGSWTGLNKLIADMNAGKVKTLIMHKVNPGYVLPESAKWADAVRKVDMVISTADRVDETSGQAHYLIPDNHALETWGDAEPVAGMYMIQQPTIRAMYDTRSFQLSLMTWAFMAKQGPARIQKFETFYDFLRDVWRTDVHPKVGKGKSFEDFWQDTLQTGYAGEMGKGGSARSFKADAFNSIKPQASSGTELVLYANVTMGDGSNTNASWLPELPDPVTKIAWDNYASVSLAFAKKNNLSEGDLIDVKVGGKAIELPVHVQPGLHDEVVAVAVGWGRTAAGKVINNIGRNVWPWMALGDSVVASGQTVEITKKHGKYDLANPQGGQTMEGRQLVVEATLAEYNKKKDANIHRHHVWSIWSGHQYNGQKWGMAIDLNSCTGCNACAIACQSENNVPVVGKQNMLRGREMHWLRIDRYYVGTPENAEVVFQPMLCQHCDNAPCETVCPVLATVHTDDGLNAMVYNRCVGTRYCSNNCPYKVRRFNWFNYLKEIEKPLHMSLNPDVTTRGRGVMEKCTFCVQRIKWGKDKAKTENRPLKDGEIKTACQTACPGGGIVFGDMNDPESAVSKAFKAERNYAVLEEWHAGPSVRYLSKIRNNGKDVRHEGGHA